MRNAECKMRNGGNTRLSFRTLHSVFCILMASFIAGCHSEGVELNWTSLPAIPEPIGYSGSLAGVTGGALLVAGGTNFPDRPPWNNGTKTWYDRIFLLASPQDHWQFLDTRLPRPIGYGVCLTAPDGVLCIGGSDARQHHTDAFILTWTLGTPATPTVLGSTNTRVSREKPDTPRIPGKPGVLTRTDLPPLPRPVANACGAIVGSTVYIAGGLAEPTATSTLHTFYTLDLSAPSKGWRELPSWPGPPRMLGVAASFNGEFYLFSGTDLSPGPDGKPVRAYLKDAYRFSPSGGWRKLPDLPRSTVAAPTPAAVIGGRIAILSGDDGSKVNFQPLEDHPGFPHDTLLFEPLTGRWTSHGDWKLPAVTTPLVQWAGAKGWVVPGGEIRPGVRTPRVQLLTPEN